MDPSQADTMLAEGSTLAAGGLGAAGMMAGSTHPGGGTRRVSPADYTGNLPPAGPPYGAERARYDDWEPERKSKMPIVAAVAAILVLALVVGVYAATRGGNDSPNAPVSPSVTDSGTVSETPTSEEPEEPTPTRTRTRQNTPPPRTTEPTTAPPTSEPPTSEPPTSEPPTSGPPTTGGGGGGGDDDGGTGAGGGGGPGTGTGG
jgi:hypothetical protein